MHHVISNPAALKGLVEYQPGSVVSRVIFKGGGGSMTLFAFAAGEGLTEHTSPHDAIVLVIEGEAHVTVAGDLHIVGEGEMLHLPPGIGHALHSRGGFKMVLTMMLLPREPDE